MIATELERTVLQLYRQFRYHLVTVLQQIATLPARLSLLAPQHSVKRLRHVAVVRHLLHDVAFSAHRVLCFSFTEDMGLPFPGPNFFEPLPAYQTLLPDT